MRTRLIVGCMSGTSIDGLDGALVRIDGTGLSMRAASQRFESAAFDDDLRSVLRRLAHGRSDLGAAEICAAAHDLAELHIAVIQELLGDERADLLVAHGQTVFHRPPLSWQLFAPALLARALGAPVVYDLRAADLAAGGQGAPITPLADFILFRNPTERRAIVNLGGFANYTLLPASAIGADTALEIAAIRGGDICLCNQLLDAVARDRLNADFDEHGAAAATGAVHPAAFESLRSRLADQAGARRSLGTADQGVEWIAEFRQRVSAADMARTACAAIGAVVAAALGGVQRIVLAGGGARNACLAREIANAAHDATPVESCIALGVPPEQREAICMAVLGALCADGVPITLPQVTGVPAPAPTAGCWVVPDGCDVAAVFRGRSASH